MTTKKGLRRFHYWKRVFNAYVFHSGHSNITFWHTPLKLNRLTEKDLTTVCAYPQNFQDKIGRVQTQDENGIIQLDYQGDLGVQYNPNAIAQLALGYYDCLLNGLDEKDNFLKQANYFLTYYRIVNGVLLWEYNFPFENRNFQSAPWRSALAQGQGISVCLRAYQITNDERYLEVAQKAFDSFKYLAHEHPGGVLDNSQGFTWLEEYIFDPPNHVLNGFIWALWGVRDYAVYFQDHYAWHLWNECVKTLRDNVEHYDVGYWTSYDLVKFSNKSQPIMPSSLYYQRLHSLQMEAMHVLTGIEKFHHYAERWRSQLNNPLYKTLSQAWKIYFKLMRY